MNQFQEECSDIVSEETYKTLLENALAIAKNFNIELDYSNDSIKKVEKILREFHKDYIANKNDEGLNGIAVAFGFYIIETIRRNFDEKGILYTNHKDFGEKSFPFYRKEEIIFPCGWCQKRIFDGKSDDVYMKYTTFLEIKPKKRFLGIF